MCIIAFWNEARINNNVFKKFDASNAGVVADPSIAACKPRQMLSKLLPVNMGVA